MGQVTQFFQPPLYWQQFEDLTQSIVEFAYGAASADKIGRPGQAQAGVDVYATRTRAGSVGVQCKRLDDLDENNDPLPGGASPASCCARKQRRRSPSNLRAHFGINAERMMLGVGWSGNM